MAVPTGKWVCRWCCWSWHWPYETRTSQSVHCRTRISCVPGGWGGGGSEPPQHPSFWMSLWLPYPALPEWMQTPHGERKEAPKVWHIKGMESVGRGKCDGKTVEEEWGGEDGDEDKYVEGRRWNGGSQITKKKEEKKEKGERVTLWSTAQFYYNQSSKHRQCHHSKMWNVCLRWSVGWGLVTQ